HSPSDSTSHFNPFHKSSRNRLVGQSKSVKRSQSFDSYFKKLRTSSSGCSNNNCCSDGSNDGNHTMVDINRNQFELLNKNDTIFEVEEMSIDCDSHLVEANNLQDDLDKPSEVNNNNLPQIDEEEPNKIELTSTLQVAASNQSN